MSAIASVAAFDPGCGPMPVSTLASNLPSPRSTHRNLNGLRLSLARFSDSRFARLRASASLVASCA
jgi:hypothetical protein